MSGYYDGLGGGSFPSADAGHDPLSGRRRGSRDAFDPAAIVIDPQVPDAVRAELRRRWSSQDLNLYGPDEGWASSGQPGYRPAMTSLPGELIPYGAPRPEVPRPPRSQATAVRLALAATALLTLSVVTGLLVGPVVFAVFFIAGLSVAALAAAASSAARSGRPSLPGGLIPLPLAGDFTPYYVAHAGRIFHRRYVRPRADLDPEALIAWRRAVDATNRIYRADCLRDQVVDADRVTAQVPELLWKIAEGLAKISDVRFDLRKIVPGAERLHPVVEAKIRAQERDLAHVTRQVGRRIDRLETVAGRLAAADAARRDEALLRRLHEVDPKIRDLVASTDESVTEVDMAEGLKLDVEAIVEMANRAISDLSTQDEDDDPNESSRMP